MNIIITTQNVTMLLSAVIILAVLMGLLMLYDYYKNVYLKTLDIDYRLEIQEKRLNELIHVLLNSEEEK